MFRTLPARRRSAQITALAVALLAALLWGSGSVPVSAAGESAREQRAKVRSQRAAVATQVDALKGDEHDVTAALAALDENVRGQEAALADARRQVEVSAAEAAQAEQAIAAAEAEIEAVRRQVVAYAVDAYITPPDEDLLRRMEASDASEDATKRALIRHRAGIDGDSLHRLEDARQRLDAEKKRAERARATAEEAAAAADRALASLTDARSQREAFAQQVRARLDEKLAEGAYLAQVDAELGQKIAAEQAALAAAVRKVPAGGSSGSGANGSGSNGASRSGGSTTKVASVPRPPLSTVGGITVHSSIAPQLRQLLTAAAAAGFDLRGYGWRDSRNQVALRGQNCGGWDNYSLYEKPPDQCSPPTARPGASLHEQGLAIDFSLGNEFIESRDSAVFKWLAANAPTYGFKNLPSEPWHWSTTGG